MDLLVESHRRIENLAKVIRMKNAKFARVDALNKNIAKERAALEDLRRERHRKNAAMDENAKRTAEMQTDIAQRYAEMRRVLMAIACSLVDALSL